MDIELPNNFTPRPYQLNLWNHLMGGGKRAVAIWHRRAGKDEVCLHHLAIQSQLKQAVYWYMAPTAVQAREAFWDAINPHTGQRRIFEAFVGMHNPDKGLYGLIASKNENEMRLDLINGSTVRFCGSDNYANLVGAPPYGLVFSEYARADPNAWNLLRPILAENGGWAVFNTTPLGENHAADLYRLAESRPERWFAELLPVEKTDVFSQETLAEELDELIQANGEDQGRSLFDQEYRVKFSGGMVGAYYAREFDKAQDENRLTKVPHEPNLVTHTSWDLGYADATAVWMVQLHGKEIRVIDYLENSNVGLDWYVKELQKRDYVWGQHVFPPDAAVKELGTGRSRVETLRSLGINPRILPQQSVMDGINAVRTILPSCWFDAVKCKRGINALRQYRRKWDDKRKCYADTPLHDWTSHAADSFRYFAMSGVRNPIAKPFQRRSQGFV